MGSHMEVIIFLNEIVVELEQEKQYRVLWISPDMSYGYWIRMDDNKMPERFEYPFLEKGLADGRFEKQDEILGKTVSTDISESSKTRRDELWEALESALTCEPDIYNRNRRKELLQEPAKKLGTPYNNLYRYLMRYWKNGKTPNAFLMERKKCGKRTEMEGWQKNREGLQGMRAVLGKSWIVTMSKIFPRQLKDTISHRRRKRWYQHMKKCWQMIIRQ